MAGDPDPDPSDDGTIGDIWDDSIAPGINEGHGSIFFPWVGNDDESTGLGPADTSVTVMNISDDPAVAFAFVGSHDTAELPDTGGWDIVGPFFLAPWASKTFTAAQLGIGEGGGAPVSFTGYNQLWSEGGSCTTNIGAPLAAGVDVNGNGRCTDHEVFVGGDNDDRSDPDLCFVDDSNGNRTNGYYGDGSGGLNNDGDCEDSEQGSSGGVKHVYPTVLGGVAKQVVDGETLPFTTAADSSVSGYNSIGGFELGEFDDWYFAIAQTNCGPGGCWNSHLRIANFGNEVAGEIGNIGSAAVTARFFPADDAQGSLDTGFQLQALVNTGDVWHIDLSDYVPEGWIGSVHVYSDSAIFAMVDRVKVGYGAWITNTASNAPHTYYYNSPGSLGQYALFAPDVRTDFFGWNTGINVANLVNEDNNVNIQYFNLFGNAATGLTRRLAAQGMTYFYDPSQAPQDNSLQDPSSDVNADIIGSAIIWSDYPVAVAVDATKYPESTNSEDPNIFQAMSYSATANVYTTQVHPLVQKGNPTEGVGATSGINIMNPNATAAQASVWWVNPSGFGADNFGTSAVAIPGFANGFVYTGFAQNLPNGFFGSAVVVSTLPVSSVTTQVDYQVEWDGTAVWLGYNPCGYYRDNGYNDSYDLYDSNCNLGDPFNTQGGQITKYFYDETGEEITGVYAELWNEAAYQQDYLGNESYAGIPWYAGGYSDVEGRIEWTNVPVGTYYLYIGEVPDGNYTDTHEGEGSIEGPFTLNEGQDWVLENELYRNLPMKYVYLGDDAAGVEVCLAEADYENGADLQGANGHGDIVDCTVADEAGEAHFYDIEPGYYYVLVNYGYDYGVVLGFETYYFGPEYFGLGGHYINDYTEEVNPAYGNIQKVILLPAELCERLRVGSSLAGIPGDACPYLEVSGIISIVDPNGDTEVEGNVQTAILDDEFGPEGTIAFTLTDFEVPVGGPYSIHEYIEITYDLDGPGPEAPVTVSYAADLYTAEDGQVVCYGAFDPTDECHASPDDPYIYVYDGYTTRVFNDLTNIITGHLDVFVRDEESDLPLAFALVCLYEAEGPVLVACDLTDGNGEAEFENVPEGFYNLTAGAPNYEVQGSGTFFYWIFFDLIFGSGLDDQLGDTGIVGEQVDIQMALDPAGTFLDVWVGIDDNPANGAADYAAEGENGIITQVYLSDPFGGDVAGTGGTCASGTLIGSDFSATMFVDGYGNIPGMTEFGVDHNDTFCVIADPNGDLIPTAVTGVTLAQFDPNDDIDVTILEGSLGVPDVQYTLNGVPQNGVPIFLHVSAAGDATGAPGVCNGPLVPSVTQPTFTTNQLVSGQGAVDGIAQFSGVDTSLTYCATAFAPGPGNPSEAAINLDPGDQFDDIDGVIPDVLLTFVGVFVEFTGDGSGPVSGETVVLYNDAACAANLVSFGVTDANGFVDFGGFPFGGDFCAVGTNTDSPAMATANIPLGDPAGDIDLTLGIFIIT